MRDCVTPFSSEKRRGRPAACRRQNARASPAARRAAEPRCSFCRSVGLSLSLEFSGLPQTVQTPPPKVIVPGTPQATPTCRHKPLLKSDHFLQLLITLCLSFWSPVPQAPDGPLALEHPSGCSTGSRWCSLHLASGTSCSLSAHLPEPRWDGEESVFLSAHCFALAEAAGGGARC